MTTVKGDLVITAVGDVHVNRPDPCSIFEHVASTLKQGDIVVGNLESLNCDLGVPCPGKTEAGSRHLRSAPHNIEALGPGGFNVMVLANNHNMDYGAEALIQCIELLDNVGIAHAGAGRNLEEAHRPAIIERNGVTTAVLSYTSIFLPSGWSAELNKPGLATIKVTTSYLAPDNIEYQPGFPPLVITMPNPTDEDRMINDVRLAKQQADIVLVAFHWGVSHGYGRVLGYQRELGRAAIDAGADLVMGCHPHTLQAMEMYKGRLICYCMGNFVMDGIKQAHFGADSMILKCQIHEKQIKAYSFTPVRISDQWQPYVLDDQNAREVMKNMEIMSVDFGTMFTMTDGEVTISGPKAGTPEAVRGLAVEAQRGLPVLVDALLPPPSLLKKLQGTYGKDSTA